jgi:hypothetical protein
MAGHYRTGVQQERIENEPGVFQRSAGIGNLIVNVPRNGDTFETVAAQLAQQSGRIVSRSTAIREVESIAATWSLYQYDSGPYASGSIYTALAQPGSPPYLIRLYDVPSKEIQGLVDAVLIPAVEAFQVIEP